MMWVRLILICLFVKDLRPGTAFCTVSKYNVGIGNWVKCSNSSLDEALERGGPNITAITISQSKISTVEGKAFRKNVKLLELNLNKCGLRDMHNNALDDLKKLKKLSLPNNRLTEVKYSWFNDLVSLEQLDLSFNKISYIGGNVFDKWTNIRRLNLDDNLFESFNIPDLKAMRSLSKIRVLENPLSLKSRGEMTLWFKDKGINYLSDLPISESWLDRVLWLCAEDPDGKRRLEKPVEQCILLNIFNQLRSALKTTNSYPISAQQCTSQARGFLSCVARTDSGIPDGDALMAIVSNLRRVGKI